MSEQKADVLGTLLRGMVASFLVGGAIYLLLVLCGISFTGKQMGPYFGFMSFLAMLLASIPVALVYAVYRPTLWQDRKVFLFILVVSSLAGMVVAQAPFGFRAQQIVYFVSIHFFALVWVRQGLISFTSRVRIPE